MNFLREVDVSPLELGSLHSSAVALSTPPPSPPEHLAAERKPYQTSRAGRWTDVAELVWRLPHPAHVLPGPLKEVAPDSRLGPMCSRY